MQRLFQLTINCATIRAVYAPYINNNCIGSLNNATNIAYARKTKKEYLIPVEYISLIKEMYSPRLLGYSFYSELVTAVVYEPGCSTHCAINA